MLQQVLFLSEISEYVSCEINIPNNKINEANFSMWIFFTNFFKFKIKSLLQISKRQQTFSQLFHFSLYFLFFNFYLFFAISQNNGTPSQTFPFIYQAYTPKIYTRTYIQIVSMQNN